MKKFLLLALSLVLCFGAFGCSSSSSDGFWMGSLATPIDASKADTVKGTYDVTKYELTLTARNASRSSDAAFSITITGKDGFNGGIYSGKAAIDSTDNGLSLTTQVQLNSWLFKFIDAYQKDNSILDNLNALAGKLLAWGMTTEELAAFASDTQYQQVLISILEDPSQALVKLINDFRYDYTQYYPFASINSSVNGTTGRGYTYKHDSSEFQYASCETKLQSDGTLQITKNVTDSGVTMAVTTMLRKSSDTPIILVADVLPSVKESVAWPDIASDNSFQKAAQDMNVDTEVSDIDLTDPDTLVGTYKIVQFTSNPLEGFTITSENDDTEQIGNTTITKTDDGKYIIESQIQISSPVFNIADTKAGSLERDAAIALLKDVPATVKILLGMGSLDNTMADAKYSYTKYAALDSSNIDAGANKINSIDSGVQGTEGRGFLYTHAYPDAVFEFTRLDAKTLNSSVSFSPSPLVTASTSVKLEKISDDVNTIDKDKLIDKFMKGFIGKTFATATAEPTTAE